MLRKEFGSFEDYLDGALDQAGRRDVETRVGADPRAAGVLAALKSHRALRAAAYESYLPTAAESQALAARMIAGFEDEVHRPLWRITPTVRRLAAVAAAVVLVAGAFMAGRTTATPATPGNGAVATANPVVKDHYRVYYVNGDETQVADFENSQECDAFVAGLREQGSAVFVADLTNTTPNHF